MEQRKTEFLAIKVVEFGKARAQKEPNLRFINRNHILQVWQDGDDVIIELTDYEKLKIPNENIYLFMDRFL